ncbi:MULTISPECIES: arginase family protein [Vibrio]|uniref:arginase family protein n=1 Tax=Vibrio TaxID=662 RepID=UPI000C16EBE5|nr:MULTISPECIES: arginase family protein [Vibrio]NAW70141.1 arginase [Vibrio sp. V28_P6S34P95]NAX04602.1 arginase [Vibrio sp. V30_P3S12P165]NAX33760.1 arginase [Vibrio sp. V29_P1S30P107]NAX37594.1 arginase [Vibrio sp. V27_P1S3P104]NAX39550.1 arginase [Vibrio sp. V26_P1S5P106]
MLSLFKRSRLSRPSTAAIPAFTFCTVCEQVKPMSPVEFEFAQQSLEFASDWLYQRQVNATYADAGHLVLRDPADSRFRDLLSHHLAMNSLPVVLGNCHELLLNALPLLALDNEELGIIHIGHQFELKQTLDRQLGSVYHFALSRYQQTHLFYFGIDPERVDSQTWEYAEDLGCNWLTEAECSFRHRTQVKNQLDHYIEHCDQLVVSVDLASLVPSHGLDEHKILDSQMVLRVLRQAIMSGKVKMIQLIGAKDKLIYSKQTKTMIDELAHLSRESFY